MRQHSSGFTQVELVMVITIIGILAGVCVPALSYLGAVRKESTATVIRRHVAFAQTTAMTTRNRTWVVFDTAGDSYACYVEDPANPGKAGRLAMTDPLTRAALSVILDQGVFGGIDLATANINGSNELEFNSRGVPCDTNGTPLSSSVSIVLSDGYSFTISADTGHVGNAS